MKIILSLSLAISAMASHSPFRQSRNEERNLQAKPVVSLLYDPLFVNAGLDCEASNVDAIIREKNLTTDPVPTLAEFLDGVSTAEALMIPELQGGSIPDVELTDARIQALQDFVKSGKPLVATIDSANRVEKFLATVFGFAGLDQQWPYSGYWDPNYPDKLLPATAEKASTVWSNLTHTNMNDLDGVWQHDVSFFPAGTLTAYGGSKAGYGSVMQIPYQSGWVYLIGYDFWSAQNVDCECWKDALVAPFLASPPVPAASAGSAVTAKCKNPDPVSVDGNCQATVQPSAVDDGSSSTAGAIASLAFLQGSDVFDVGSNLVTLEVTDDQENTGACQAEVTTIDTTPPQIPNDVPSTVAWNNKPKCFTASKTDNCASCGTDTTKVVSHTCQKRNNKGRWVDITGTAKCRVAMNEDKICIRSITSEVKVTWIAVATDCSGNLAEREFSTRITYSAA